MEENQAISDSQPKARPFVSPREVAEMTGVHIQTVKRWEYEGKLKGIKINSRVTRYRREDVAKLFEQ